MSDVSYYLLWENDEYSVGTPKNPHISHAEGVHLTLAPKQHLATAWESPAVTGKLFELAARVCKVVEHGLAPWFNIQANGNWGLIKNEAFLHVHIYGRNKTSNWGKPLILPESPGTFKPNPMPLLDRTVLIEAFKELI